MRWLPLAAAFVASLLLLPGCGGSKASVAITRQAPVLTSVTTTPEDLRFSLAGGTITLRVAVDSAVAVSAVTAERSLLNTTTPGTITYPLVPVGEGLYQTDIQVPSNLSASAVRYRLSVYADDANGSESDRIQYEIYVAPPDSGGIPGGWNPTFPS